MGYLLENKLYWKYENITQLAKKNVSDARKIVEKNKEGIEELLHQGVNLDKIKNLSETDKELMAALYILVYREEKDKRINNKTNKEFIEAKKEKHLMGGHLFKYEPSEKEVLDSILPRLIEVQLFQALLESNASEHSARMAAMHQATNAANDLVDELTLYYNKARQAAITAEIAEISAGAATLNS